MPSIAKQNKRATEVMAAKTGIAQVEAVHRSDQIAFGVDAVIARTWKQLNDYLQSIPPLIVGANQVYAQVVALLRSLHPSLKSEVDAGLVRLALWSHARAKQSITDAVPERFLRAVTLREDDLKPAKVLPGFIGLGKKRKASKEPSIPWTELPDVADLLMPPPTKEQADRFIRGVGEGGKSWETRLSGLSKLASPEAMANVIAQGYAAGKSQREVAADLKPILNGVASSARRVARTEGLRVNQEMQKETWKQADELIAGYQIHAVLDERTRPEHAARAGRKWLKADGGSMQQALGMEGETLPDAPNCLLPGTFVQGRFVAASRAFYAGQIAELVTASGNRLAVTMNHPVLTDQGFIPAHAIRDGDWVLSHLGHSGYHELLKVEDVFDRVRDYGERHRQPVPASAFHGDGISMRGDVEIIRLAVRAGPFAGVNVAIGKDAGESVDADAELIRRLSERFPDAINRQQVIGIEIRDYSGFVYDLQSPLGYYSASGYADKETLLLANCRCWLTPIISTPEEFIEDPSKLAVFETDKEKVIPDPAVYSEWFSNASEAQRRTAVGSGRYSLLADKLGDALSWEHFIDPETGSLLPVSQLKYEKAAKREERVADVRGLIAKRKADLERTAAFGFLPPEGEWVAPELILPVEPPTPTAEKPVGAALSPLPSAQTEPVDARKWRERTAAAERIRELAAKEESRDADAESMARDADAEADFEIAVQNHKEAVQSLRDAIRDGDADEIAEARAAITTTTAEAREAKRVADKAKTALKEFEAESDRIADELERNSNIVSEAIEDAEKANERAQDAVDDLADAAEQAETFAQEVAAATDDKAVIERAKQFAKLAKEAAKRAEKLEAKVNKSYDLAVEFFGSEDWRGSVAAAENAVADAGRVDAELESANSFAAQVEEIARATKKSKAPASSVLTTEKASLAAKEVHSAILLQHAEDVRESERIAVSVAKARQDIEKAKQAFAVETDDRKKEELREEMQRAAANAALAKADFDRAEGERIEKARAALVQEKPNPNVYMKAGTSMSRENKKTLKNQTEFLKSVLHESVGEVDVEVRQVAGERAYHAEKTIVIDKDEKPHVVAHEMGHELESNPKVRAAASEFLAKRVGDEPFVELSATNAKYGKGERGRRDDFAKLFPGDEDRAYYVGKVYPNGETEIVAIGLELMHRDPGFFAAKDPEYFQFIKTVMNGGYS